MYNSLIMLSSITYAIKAQRYLETKGIYSNIVRTPEHLKTKGCSYSLSVSRNPEQVASHLSSVGFNILGII